MSAELSYLPFYSIYTLSYLGRLASHRICQSLLGYLPLVMSLGLTEDVLCCLKKARLCTQLPRQEIVSIAVRLRCVDRQDGVNTDEMVGEIHGGESLSYGLAAWAKPAQLVVFCLFRFCVFAHSSGFLHYGSSVLMSWYVTNEQSWRTLHFVNVSETNIAFFLSLPLFFIPGQREYPIAEPANLQYWNKFVPTIATPLSGMPVKKIVWECCPDGGVEGNNPLGTNRLLHGTWKGGS